MKWGSLEERFERTMLGRVVISAFVIVTLISVLTANLPISRLQDLLLTATHRYIYGAGLDQNWSVFAPDPRRETIDVTAKVTFADGSTATWKVPRRNDVIGAYVDYRWLKWAEYVIAPAYADRLPRPFALYVAREFATPTRRPVRVVLNNRYHSIPPPGSNEPLFVQEGSFYTTRVSEADLR